MLFDLDLRFRVMDQFGDYRQVISIASPPLEAFAGPEVTPGLARVSNDAMAELVRCHPDRFAGFIACLPMNNPAEAEVELHRSVRDLGARGVQIFSNVNGLPLDRDEFRFVFAAMSGYDVTLCDVTPAQLVEMGGARLSDAFASRLRKYRYGPAVFKIDYALSSPVPWKAAACLRAATVHVGGSSSEISVSESDMRAGYHSERPFVLVAQPSLFDPSRAPEGKHTAWAYCHVPNGSTVDMQQTIEKQIERFAPGFRDCILARRVFAPAALEKMDANLVGGDISGGAMDLRQFFLRPTWRHYATSAKNIFLCSSSTPPGGGVHGMCGYHAAKMALSRLNA